MKTGDQVGWKWGSGIATGLILEIRSGRTRIESNGKMITRNGRSEDLAVIILGDNGSKVLKLAHEVQVIRRGNDV